VDKNLESLPIEGFDGVFAQNISGINNCH